MTAGHAIGLALQLVGLLVMGLGVWRTWREFALPGENLVEPITRAGRAAWTALVQRTEALWRRILRRPRRVEAHAEFASAVGMAARLQASDLTSAVLELERRVGQLVDRLADVDERVQDEREADLVAVAELRERLAGAIADLEARDRRVALGGLRLEMFGLFLTALGLVVATVW